MIVESALFYRSNDTCLLFSNILLMINVSLLFAGLILVSFTHVIIPSNSVFYLLNSFAILYICVRYTCLTVNSSCLLLLVVSIEDPFDQDHWDAWSNITNAVSIQIVGYVFILYDLYLLFMVTTESGKPGRMPIS